MPNDDLAKNSIRLSKLMAERGLCSRREADYLIAQGWVQVDGVTINVLGTRVSPNAKVTLHEQAQTRLKEAVTIILNKPVGYVSGQPEKEYEPAIVLITEDRRDKSFDGPRLARKHLLGLAPAGRLDIDSQGILVFTQDGAIARRLVGPNSQIEKEYLVRVQGDLSNEGLNSLRHGLVLDGQPLKEAQVEWINQDQLRFVLREGKKRQIRRMCEMVGLKVTGLKRVRVGKVRLGKLGEGKWRYLLPEETF